MYRWEERGMKWISLGLKDFIEIVINGLDSIGLTRLWGCIWTDLLFKWNWRVRVLRRWAGITVGNLKLFFKLEYLFANNWLNAGCILLRQWILEEAGYINGLGWPHEVFIENRFVYFLIWFMIQEFILAFFGSKLRMKLPNINFYRLFGFKKHTAQFTELSYWYLFSYSLSRLQLRTIFRIFPGLNCFKIQINVWLNLHLLTNCYIFYILHEATRNFGAWRINISSWVTSRVLKECSTARNILWAHEKLTLLQGINGHFLWLLRIIPRFCKSYIFIFSTIKRHAATSNIRIPWRVVQKFVVAWSTVEQRHLFWQYRTIVYIDLRRQTLIVTTIPLTLICKLIKAAI